MPCIGTCIIFPDNNPGDPIAIPRDSIGILRVCPLIAKACCPTIQNVVIEMMSKVEHTIGVVTFVLAYVNGLFGFAVV